MNKTIISWATHTLNVVHGCSKPAAVPPAGLKVYRELGLDSLFRTGPLRKWTKPNTSPECIRCYAEHLSNQRGNYAVKMGKKPTGWTTEPWTEENAKENVNLRPERIQDIRKLPLQPQDLKPSERNRIFICSMGDIFHSLVPDQFLQDLFYWMRCYPNIYMLLTKRPDRAAEFEPKGGWPEWVWLGSTIGHPMTAWRAHYLRQSPAKVRFISMEPMLDAMTPGGYVGGVDEVTDATRTILRDVLWNHPIGIHQVIVGGESGQGFRRMDMHWARDVREVCCKRKIAFFFKQDAAFQTEVRPYLVEQDGRRHKYQQFPGELTEPQLFGNEPASSLPVVG